MQVVVIGNENAFNELQTTLPASVELISSETFNIKRGDVAAAFLLDDNYDLSSLNIVKEIPVFVNAVSFTRSELNLKDNFHRINGWPGFLKNLTWEIESVNVREVEIILNALGKKGIFVRDEKGFVSPRVISMIINEAYYALAEGVSSIEEIDTAMKLGTNYPYGPFEWSQMIGLDKVVTLLKELSKTDNRCKPASLMLRDLSDSQSASVV